MRFIVTGDTHGHNAERIQDILKNVRTPEDISIIILGDAGFNFYLNKTDEKNKKIINKLGAYIYCVRGNHEERPENIKGMVKEFDKNVNGYVYLEPRFEYIRYLIDGEEYDFGSYHALVVGGAYSVDKYYRLSRYHNCESGWCGWFKDEQLTQEEMDRITEKTKGKRYDFVLSHTCPFAWRPTDLFLRGLDQSSVDTTMERWMNKLKNNFEWEVWLFGHYHDDRVVRPHVEMYYTDYEDLENIHKRWEVGIIPWWLKIDPNFDEEENHD